MKISIFRVIVFVTRIRLLLLGFVLGVNFEIFSRLGTFKLMTKVRGSWQNFWGKVGSYGKNSWHIWGLQLKFLAWLKVKAKVCGMVRGHSKCLCHSEGHGKLSPQGLGLREKVSTALKKTLFNIHITLSRRYMH